MLRFNEVSSHAVTVHGSEAEQAVNALSIYGQYQTYMQPDKRMLLIVKAPDAMYIVIQTLSGECVTAFASHKSWSELMTWIHSKNAKRIH